MKTLFKTSLILLSVLWMTGCNTLAQLKPADQSPTGEPIDILLLAMDQGDNEVFSLLLPELRRRNLETRVLTLGHADTVFAGEKEAIPLDTLVTLPANVIDDLTLLLDEKSLERVAGQFRPTVVFTGMSRAIEAQLSNRFRDNKTTTIAFYDHVDLISQTPSVAPWLNTTTGVDELLLPGHYQAADADNLSAFKKSRIAISGTPSLEQWDTAFLMNDAEEQELRLGLDAERPVILFTGSDDPGYPQWLTLFLQAMSERPDIQVLIAPHPQTDGQLERTTARSLNLKNVRVTDSTASTAQLATVADMVVACRSISGFQAARQGLPVLFILPGDDINFLTNEGLASRASNWQQILNEIHRAIDLPKTREVTPFKIPGVPEQSLQRIADHLQTTVRQVIGAGSPILESLQVEDNRQ